MNAGALRHRVSIQRRGDARDALGQPLDDWTEVVSVWADITDNRGREFLESREAVVNEVTTSVRIRYREDIQPQMRVLEQCHARRGFNITNVRYNGAPRPELLLECEEQRVEAVA